MLKLSPLQLSVWSQVTEWRADGSSSRKRWLIELQCDCPESVQPAWLTPSIPPSLPPPPPCCPVPSSITHGRCCQRRPWEQRLENLRSPQLRVCVQFSSCRAVLFCYFIIVVAKRSLPFLLRVSMRSQSVEPSVKLCGWTCVFTSTCLSLWLRLLQLTSDPALFSFFFHSENSKRSRWRGSRDTCTKRQWAEYDGRAKLNFLSFLKVFSSLIHLQRWWISGTSFSVTSVGSLTPWESLRSYLGHRHLGRSWRSLKQVRV